jgi:SAM-dependent methyltransferase
MFHVKHCLNSQAESKLTQQDTPPTNDTPDFCNYEGSQYRTDFWEDQGREYEDRVERVAIREMLPPTGRRIVDLGAGFGRLIDLYQGYDQVVLLDYSRSLLEEARARLGGDGRFTYVVGNLYNLPFNTSAFDAAVMVRVIHHLAEPPVALAEINRILASGQRFILEYANKRNVKAILRYLLRRQTHDPFSLPPYEFVPLNFNFHPHYIEKALAASGFAIEAERAVSAFRLPWLKRLMPPRWLAGVDKLLQQPIAPLKLTPSIFVQTRSITAKAAGMAETLFRCPACGAVDLVAQGETLVCQNCAQRWSIQDGIYDFKTPLSSSLSPISGGPREPLS